MNAYLNIPFLQVILKLNFVWRLEIRRHIYDGVAWQLRQTHFYDLAESEIKKNTIKYILQEFDKTQSQDIIYHFN